MTLHSSPSRRLWTCTTAFFLRTLPVSSLSSTRSMMGNDVLSTSLHALSLCIFNYTIWVRWPNTHMQFGKSHPTTEVFSSFSCQFHKKTQLSSRTSVVKLSHDPLTACCFNPNKSPALILWSCITGMTPSMSPTQTLCQDVMV